MVRPPGRPLRQRDRLGAAPPQVDGDHGGGGLHRRDRPAGHRGRLRVPARNPTAGTIAIDVRTPSTASLEYSRLKVEQAAAQARTLAETKATNSYVNPGGGRVYVDIGKSNTRKRTAEQIAAELRARWPASWAPNTSCWTTSTTAPASRCEIRFSGPDSRRLMAITSDYMEKMRKIPGAVDVGLSEQEPIDELKIEIDRGLANAMGISVGDAAQALRVAFAGVEVGDWVDPDRRVARRRGAPASRRPRRRLQHRAPADRGGRPGQRHDGAARPDRQYHHGQGPGADPALGRQAHDRGLRQCARTQRRAR